MCDEKSIEKASDDSLPNEPNGSKNKDVVDINTSLFKLALPVFLQALLGMALGSVDTIMLSNYSNTAVGAVGNANQVLGFLTLAFTIISSATGVIVSQYLGAGEKGKISVIYTVSVGFNLVLSATISLIVFFGSTALLTLMQVPDEMMADAETYMRLVGGCIFLQALIDTFSQVLRSNGKVVFGMAISLVMNIVNVIGNYLFLYGPLSKYVTGSMCVAIPTIISRLLCLIMIGIYFHYKIEGNISLKYLKPFPKDIVKSLVKLGIPTAGENISYNISQLVISAFVNTLGVAAINARTYCNTLQNFSYLYSLAIAVATQIIVGHAVGAGKYDFAYKRVYKSILPAELVSVSIAIVNFLLSPLTLRIFDASDEEMALARTVMFIIIFLEVGRTCNLIIINSMRAAGDVKFPTYLGIVVNWGVSVLFAYIFGIYLQMGLRGIWIAMAADEIVRGVVVLIRWRRGSWRGKRVVQSSENHT